jgi:hypothetical protein
MTLEYLEIMEDLEKCKNAKMKELNNAPRKKCIRSFKSNTRVFDDDSIEVTPQEKGEPSQKDVKKVGRSKRYATTGKNPLTCIELKCPDEVADKAAFFRKELAKLTKDMEIEEPQMPKGEYLLNEPSVKVMFAADEQKVVAWLTFEVEGLLDVRTQLYQLSSKIDKCFVINEALVRQPK